MPDWNCCNKLNFFFSILGGETSYFNGIHEKNIKFQWTQKNNNPKKSASHQTFSHTICVRWTITFLQRLPTNTPRLVWYVWELCLHASSLNVFPSVCQWTQHAHIQARWVNVLVPWRKNIDATDSWWKVYSSHDDLILMVGSPQTKRDISWR